MSEHHTSQSLNQLIIGSWISRAIYVAAKLRIADRLADGPRTADELAKEAGVTSRPLFRVLRALAGIGVFDQMNDSRFRLTPMGECLREDVENSSWAFSIMLGEEQDRSWDDLLETVRTGETAFDRVHGQSVFAFMREHPAQAQIFNTAISNLHGQDMRAMLDAYDLSDVQTLADIGGGVGSNLAAVLSRYPKMRGLLFDLPHVVEQAHPRLKAAGISDRYVVQGGNVFKTAPIGADAYLLCDVLHDWDDEKAGLILGNLRRAMPAKARLLAIDYVLPEGGGWSFGKLLDLQMMLIPGGRERTEAEHQHLLSSHGFRLTRLVPISSGASVIEAVPA